MRGKVEQLLALTGALAKRAEPGFSSRRLGIAGAARRGPGPGILADLGQAEVGFLASPIPSPSAMAAGHG